MQIKGKSNNVMDFNRPHVVMVIQMTLLPDLFVYTLIIQNLSLFAYT